MKQVIYKYDLNFGSWITTRRLPKGAEILSIQNQHDKIMMWVKIDSGAAELEPRTFCIQGTGEPFDDRALTYIGTIQLTGFVWHIFEVRDPTLPQQPESDEGPVWIDPMTNEARALTAISRTYIEDAVGFAFDGPPKAWFYFPEEGEISNSLSGPSQIIYETFAFGALPPTTVEELSREASRLLHAGVRVRGRRVALAWRQHPQILPRSNEKGDGWIFRCRFALIAENGDQIRLDDLTKEEGDRIIMINERGERV